MRRERSCIGLRLIEVNIIGVIRLTREIVNYKCTKCRAKLTKLDTGEFRCPNCGSEYGPKRLCTQKARTSRIKVQDNE